MISEHWKNTGGTITTFDTYDQHQDNLRGLIASIDATPAGKFYYNNIDPGKTVAAKWNGYRLQMLGVVVGQYSKVGITSDASLGKIEEQRLMRMFPYETFSPPEYPDYIVRPCRIRLYYKEVRLFAERIIYGDDEGIAIRFPMPRLAVKPHYSEEFQDWHLDPQFLQKDLDRILKGLDLLRDNVKKFGRSRGSRTYSQADFFNAAVEAFIRCYERGDKRPSGLDVASEMNISKAAFNAHKRDYGIRQNDISKEAMDRINQEN